ncbi:hypothetical protein [Nostoc sp. UHCC 0870]|uniref:hypothetical protein n=1 Tax=Nostoc sp. UHCC 0870 TaxID=2914041 RepID=UPI001EDDDD08|nr:hypothetical protein [Nostoc sp. UHCC 0870]UKP01454.1 hypothetical protein L6494_30075 [Nostoc sp. UHCC 0870]
MAENRRVRLEPHIEEYLQSHATRVLGKSPEKISGAELTTIANSLLYEHKLAYGFVEKIPLMKVFNCFANLVSNSTTISPSTPASLPKKEAENFDFDADLGDLFEEAA